MTDNNQNSREQFYQHISGQNLTPLWESLHHLVPKTPNANCAPAYWITFDIIKHRCPHYFPADKVFSMDTFHFQRMKEAFHADYAASVAPDNLLNSTGLHGPCER